MILINSLSQDIALRSKKVRQRRIASFSIRLQPRPLLLPARIFISFPKYFSITKQFINWYFIGVSSSDTIFHAFQVVSIPNKDFFVSSKNNITVVAITKKQTRNCVISDSIICQAGEKQSATLKQEPNLYLNTQDKRTWSGTRTLCIVNLPNKRMKHCGRLSVKFQFG